LFLLKQAINKEISMEEKQYPKASLVLADGTTYQGQSFGAELSVSGECVFQTGMVGYIESLTDPSYRGQILILAYPLIGNYGVPPEDLNEYGFSKNFESSQIQVAGLIVADYSDQYSHWNAKSSLGDWLKKNNVPAVFGIDTRALIKKIRHAGVMLGRVLQAKDKLDTVPLEDPNSRNLVAEVSTKEVKVYGSGDKTIMMVDCGIKYNQIRCFLQRGVKVKVVPWDYDFAKDYNEFDGLFLSNGPGDPVMASTTVNNLKRLLEKEEANPTPKPIFGICLGNQLLGLAAGAKTYKLKFGNRGHNQPCVDEQFSGRCHLTMQNHGYAIDVATLPPQWKQYFYNANDKTNEGIFHTTKPFFSVQFHPEAKGGPVETEYLFDYFLSLVRGQKFDHPLNKKFPNAPTKRESVTKVLLLGSGGLSIGQAGEFDYSGSQAIKAMKEEGIRTILINPNIATVQTTPGLADRVYFLPITPEFVKKVIEIEKPDGILLQFGGQTALNCGVSLYKSGTLADYGVKVLGTPVDTIITTEDRELFANAVKEISEFVAPSAAVTNVEDAIVAAEKIGYPVILRSAFALGGLGSGFANNREELTAAVRVSLASSSQVLIERSLKGWKEIEYEVVRDAFDNCITVCNMENFDPLGIHTGESIVVAPSQTLTDQEYHMLRKCAIKVVRHLGVVGECNIQYALNPNSEEYFIIEVNARLSRSSAMASKATGYPLAFVAAKLSLGYSLLDLKNKVTQGATTTMFEPSLDYCVVKVPRWDLKKFEHVNKTIGTAMKSVGEVMAIGRNFEETIQKACRMVNDASLGFMSGVATPKDLEHNLINASYDRIFVIAEALKQGMTVDKIHSLTCIDKWFLYKLKRVSDLETKMRKIRPTDLTSQVLLQAKKLGFSDKAIAKCMHSTETVIRDFRKQHAIVPFVKQVDTVAAEFPAHNNYLYMTYNATEDDIEQGKGAVIILGSGAYCIGSSVEFDWCAVSATHTASKLGHKTIMINYNPETVSTDYDECDKLYFEELTFERIADIYERESPLGVIVSMGGQMPNNVAMALHRAHFNILGTSPESIDSAENRYKFSRLLDTLGVDQPRWKECRAIEETKAFCESVGYPCLVRPSFVLSGAGMNVVHTPTDLEAYLGEATEVSKDYPVVISKFIMYAKEVDVDAVAQNGRLLVRAISEHVENAGVHSGDATLMLPAQDLDPITISKIEAATEKIIRSLNVSGPLNIQFIAKDNDIKVIECNLRSSRSFPFVSKVLGIDFAVLASKVILGVPCEPITIDPSKYNYVGVKVPTFSFSRLQGADPVLGVEMASTGEVACLGENKYSAFLKGFLSSGFKMPKNKNALLSVGAFKEKGEFLPFARKLVDMGYTLFGTPGSADYFAEHEIPVKSLYWPSETGSENVERSIHHALQNGVIDLCIIIPSKNRFIRPSHFMSKGYKLRRMAIDLGIPVITDIKVAKLFVDALTYVPADIPVDPLLDARRGGNIVLLPGLVDVHVHLREPGDNHKEDWDSGTCAALAGGVTIVCAMPNTKPSIIDAKSFQMVSRIASEKARCDYGIFLGAAIGNAQVVAGLSKNAFALKMYLDPTFTTLKLDSLNDWADHFKHWPSHMPLFVHAEKRNMAAALLMAHLYDRQVHVCHVSLAEELSVIKKAKERGVKVTCEVCPHHLFMSTEDLEKLGHGRCEVRPRLSPQSDVDYLWANMDVIDVISTDHAPHCLYEKDSDQPPPGFPGLETSLTLMLTAVHQGKITLEDVIAKMSTNPRRIFNLPEQPDTYIEVDLDETWTIPAAMPFSKCQWTPFAGMEVKGRVTQVVLRGKVAYQDGKILVPLGYGQNIAHYRTMPEETALPIVPIEAPVVPIPKVAEIINVPSSPAKKKKKAEQAVATTTVVPEPTLLAPLLKDEQGLSKLRGKSILSVSQFSRADLHFLFTVATDMRTMVNRMGSLELLKGKVLANVFFEPSTRTSSSFYAAMVRLGGSVVPFNESTSSTQKGETLVDTIKTLECYSDVIVLRHPVEGSAATAAKHSSLPVINAGDGIGEHPTQALLDVFTIREELGTVNNITVTLVGDLKHGRTVHSLVRLLSLYSGINLNYVSPPSLAMPRHLIDELNAKGVVQKEFDSLDPVLANTDVLYVTRIQKERFASAEEYEKVKGSYIITPEVLTEAKETMAIMHPLPRVDEISTLVDSDPRAAYFRQMENGMYIRMALLALVLGKV
jgi:carbamoyl-phosphate synthase/aspartate carbamoyltransferase/dihydroorotase